MKLKYFGIYLFPFVLALPLPLIYSSIALLLFIINIFIVDKSTINIKSFKDPLVLLCIVFFLLDFIRSVLNMSFDDNLFHEVRLAFIFTPAIVLSKRQILIKQYKYICSFFVLGVLIYIFSVWCYVYYYYQIKHPTYILDLTDYYLKYVLNNEFPLAIHHTYIGMYITLSFILIQIYTFYKKRIKVKYGVAILIFLIFNSFFIGSKVSTGFLLLSVFLLLFINGSKSFKFKSVKYYLIAFILIVTIGLYNIKEWMFYTISNSFNQRIKYYKKSFGIIRENLFGIGKDQLNNTPLNHLDLDQGRLIPHNIFIYETLVNGIVGLVILLSLFAFIILKSVKYKQIDMFLFIIMFITIGMIEDLLMRQRGVLFFIFFTSIYYAFTQFKNTVINEFKTA